MSERRPDYFLPEYKGKMDFRGKDTAQQHDKIVRSNKIDPGSKRVHRMNAVKNGNAEVKKYYKEQDRLTDKRADNLLSKRHSEKVLAKGKTPTSNRAEALQLWLKNKNKK